MSIHKFDATYQFDDLWNSSDTYPFTINIIDSPPMWLLDPNPGWGLPDAGWSGAYNYEYVGTPPDMLATPYTVGGNTYTTVAELFTYAESTSASNYGAFPADLQAAMDPYRIVQIRSQDDHTTDSNPVAYGNMTVNMSDGTQISDGIGETTEHTFLSGGTRLQVVQNSEGDVYMLHPPGTNFVSSITAAAGGDPNVGPVSVEFATYSPTQTNYTIGFDGTGTINHTMNVTPFVVCFAEGMMIETENGEVAVEDIQIGDKLRTLDNGFQPVRFVHKTTVFASGSNAPVVFEKGAIGNDRELVVSQNHNMYTKSLPKDVLPREARDFEDHLIHAHKLVNGTTIRIRREKKRVTYYHIMLDQHELLYCHGTISESWHPLKRNLRRFKGNSEATRKELLRLFPEIAHNYLETCPQVRPDAIRSVYEATLKELRTLHLR